MVTTRWLTSAHLAHQVLLYQTIYRRAQSHKPKSLNQKPHHRLNLTHRRFITQLQKSLSKRSISLKLIAAKASKASMITLRLRKRECHPQTNLTSSPQLMCLSISKSTERGMSRKSWGGNKRRLLDSRSRGRDNWSKSRLKRNNKRKSRESIRKSLDNKRKIGCLNKEKTS